MRPEASNDPKDLRLAKWYREGGRPEPSAALDEAILAAVHREVHAGPRSADSAVRRWRVPLSLAAVVVLSVTVVTLVTDLGGDLAGTGESPRREESTVQAPGARAGPKPGEEAPIPKGGLGDRSATERVQTERVAAPDVPQRAATQREDAGGAAVAHGASDSGFARREDARLSTVPPEATAPATKKTPAMEGSATAAGSMVPEPDPKWALRSAPGQMGPPATESASSERRSLAKREAEARAKPGRDVVDMLKALENQPAERWLEEIRALRQSQRDADADEILAAFRRRFPGHPSAPVK